eukprot:TRINITY_DN247_c0_g2_i1.p1 TRINITY_DN247_c0_g2~~TRINITY_DN247_c0_g2_i1.p1  ORF type:complete len:191 (+),score=46.88 TRINITY_DN247_c0_g2_i1:125-697(+)
MCRWYCTSSGPSTNLVCLHCGTHYCGACLHNEKGKKMASLVKCAECGKKPRVKASSERGQWKGDSQEPEFSADRSGLSLREGFHSHTSPTKTVSVSTTSKSSSPSEKKTESKSSSTKTVKSTTTTTSTSSSSSSSEKKSPSKKSSGGSIFDRLTDSSQYTGAHKLRFDDSGNGRGLSGRDSLAKGRGSRF